MDEVTIASAVLFLSGFVYGCTGFGFGLIAVPALALVVGPDRAVPLTSFVSLPPSLYLLIGARRSIRPRLLAVLLAGAVVATPLGAWALRSVPAEPMKAGMGILFVVLAVVLLGGWKRPLGNAGAGTFAAGAAAGLMGSGAGVPGPPILLFLANQGERKDVVRATLAAFFLCSYLLSLVAYQVAGLVDRSLGILALQTIPAALLGSGLGLLASKKLSERLFRKIALVLVALSGAVLLATTMV